MQYLNFSWLLGGALAGAQGPKSRRDLVFYQRNDIRAMVRLDEGTISGEAYDILDLYEPVPDFTAPRLDQIERIVKWIDEQIETWERPVAVTCGAGLGRTGTVLACYLVYVGYSPEDAVKYVREIRPGSIELPEQEETVLQYATLLKTRQREVRRKGMEGSKDD